MLHRSRLIGLAGCAFLAACQSMTTPWPSEKERLHTFLQEAFEADLQASPEWLSYLGRKDRAGEWNDRSEAGHARDAQRVARHLERLRDEFSLAALDPEDQLHYRLFEVDCERKLKQHRWRWHRYPVNQMHGEHRAGLQLLLNAHRMETARDAETYVERLEGMGDMLAQIAEGVREREARGVLPPRFVFAKVLQDCERAAAGVPMDDGPDENVLWADFQTKLNGLEDLRPRARKALLERAERALRETVGPAFRDLHAVLADQASRATTDAGVWKLPEGEAFYRAQLSHHTTTGWSAEEIHALGLREVDRLHAAMRAIQAQVGFEGSLGEFFEHLRTDERFFYPNTEEGKARYLAEATARIDAMRARLPEVFATLPQAAIEVRAVEPYRERSAGKAFYNPPAPDGSRPGIYYANLYQMADMPIYQMEALAYHEGIPGHHMQIAIAQELEGVPEFRKFGHYTAYVEGWGLYSEFLPKEMGFYADPYSDFGRLAMELWRACRLVVDTGLHAKRWTREQAIEYLATNTPNPEGDCIKAVERYIVMPGQATAYQVGLLRLLELRAWAQAELGDAFDLRAFHDVILLAGPMPLDLLEERVQAWVARVQTEAASVEKALRG